jgi:hypothetical protein
LEGGFIRNTNTSISTDLFGVPFGPLDGYKNGLFQVGWNNQNRVLYFEILSNSVTTQDGLKIGDTKDRVLEFLGVPFIETSSIYRFQNIEFEVIGILFQFENDRVAKIIL